MYNHNNAQQSKNRVHISWDILYLSTLIRLIITRHGNLYRHYYVEKPLLPLSVPSCNKNPKPYKRIFVITKLMPFSRSIALLRAHNSKSINTMWANSELHSLSTHALLSCYITLPASKDSSCLFDYDYPFHAYMEGTANYMKRIIKRWMVANIKTNNRSKYPANFFHSRRRFASSWFFLTSVVIILGYGTWFLPIGSGSDFESSYSMCVECTFWSSFSRTCLPRCPLLPGQGWTSFSRGLWAHRTAQDIQACTFLSHLGISRGG